MPVVDVAVHFNEAVPVSKADRDTIANGLIELVSKNLPNSDASVTVEVWRQPNNPLPWIRSVRLFRAAFLTKHHWSVPRFRLGANGLHPRTPAHHRRKNSKHGRYRQRCDECWLLIVASGGRPSGLFEPSAETKNHLYHSLFEEERSSWRPAGPWADHDCLTRGTALAFRRTGIQAGLTGDIKLSDERRTRSSISVSQSAMILR